MRGPQDPPLARLRPAAAASFYGSGAAGASGPVPRHDPSAPNALVLAPAPPGGVAVVVDPCLAQRLRPHQRDGVAFLYRCLGETGPSPRGCLLCDEMGVGKTLQVVTLLWTLLRQSSAGGDKPAVRRALVACPASLVGLWRSEVRKWLGPTRLGVLAVPGGPHARAALSGWAKPGGAAATPLCVVSYDTLRACAADLGALRPGLLVCDEGHRLKASGGSKTVEALKALQAERCVLLSGTPIQNDLDEFFTLADFAAPGALGSRAQFRALYAAPVEAARCATATPAQRAAGAAAAAALRAATAPFLLRRTAEVNNKHLPPRQEFVVFCRPSPLQAALHAALLASPPMAALLGGAGGAGTKPLQPLAAITLLRRLATSPAEALSYDAHDRTTPAGATLAAMRAAAAGASAAALGASGKQAVLEAMLRALKAAGEAGGRIVLVAGWTSVLDVLQRLCDAVGLATMRLDGSVPPDKRSALVRAFNAGTGGRTGTPARVCLLSTRAGGVGLSLVGASRLVLCDPDWNPAADAQALARVWRDGQREAVHVYRLLTGGGSLEERIYQRALAKRQLADAVETGGAGEQGAATGDADGAEADTAAEAEAEDAPPAADGRFSAAELRQLFAPRPEPADALCETAALMRRAGGEVAASWSDASSSVRDPPLRAAVAAGSVAFVHAPPVQGGQGWSPGARTEDSFVRPSEEEEADIPLADSDGEAEAGSLDGDDGGGGEAAEEEEVVPESPALPRKRPRDG